MIEKEAWYKEALEEELQRTLRGLPQDVADPSGEEHFQQLKRIYLRTGKLPDEVKEQFSKWVLHKVNRGDYDQDDLRVVWEGSDGLPLIPVQALMDSPEDVLPRVQVSENFSRTVYDFTGLEEDMLYEAMWFAERGDPVNPEHQPYVERIRDAEHTYDSADSVANIKEVVRYMTQDQGKFGKWRPVSGGHFTRKLKGHSPHWPDFSQFAGQDNAVWEDHSISVHLSESLEDHLMEALFLKGPGPYRALRDWLKELGRLDLGWH